MDIDAIAEAIFGALYDRGYLSNADYNELRAEVLKVIGDILEQML